MFRCIVVLALLFTSLAPVSLTGAWEPIIVPAPSTMTPVAGFPAQPPSIVLPVLPPTAVLDADRTLTVTGCPGDVYLRMQYIGQGDPLVFALPPPPRDGAYLARWGDRVGCVVGGAGIGAVKVRRSVVLPVISR